MARYATSAAALTFWSSGSRAIQNASLLPNPPGIRLESPIDLPEEKRLGRDPAASTAAAGGAQARDECRRGQQPVEPADNAPARSTRTGVHAGCDESFDALGDGASDPGRGDRHDEGQRTEQRQQSAAGPRRAAATPRPAGKARRERDRDRDEPDWSSESSVDRSAVEPQADGGACQRSKRQEVAPAEGDGAVSPALERRVRV